MAAAWNGHAADDGASNLWLCSSSTLRVTFVVRSCRAGRHQLECKHNGRRGDGYGCGSFYEVATLKLSHDRSPLSDNLLMPSGTIAFGRRARKLNGGARKEFDRSEGPLIHARILRARPMPALGPKRTCAVQEPMSALHPIADMCGAARMSATGQKRTHENAQRVPDPNAVRRLNTTKTMVTIR